MRSLCGQAYAVSGRLTLLTANGCIRSFSRSFLVGGAGDAVFGAGGAQGGSLGDDRAESGEGRSLDPAAAGGT